MVTISSPFTAFICLPWISQAVRRRHIAKLLPPHAQPLCFQDYFYLRSSCERPSRYGQVNLTSHLRLDISRTLFKLWDVSHRKNALWMSALLLLVVLGVAETKDPLTDLGRPSSIFSFTLSLQAPWLHTYLSFKQKILLASWFSTR